MSFTMNSSPILPIDAVGYLGRGILDMFVVTVLCMYGLSFLEGLLVELYCEHLPLHHESVAAVLSMRLLELKYQTDWYLEPCT
jgi:hypothetical protein